MKAKIYTLLLLCALLHTGCEKDFLERTPSTDITAENFFSSVADLETYTNSFYDHLGYSYNDLGSDNISHYNSGGEVEQLLRGEITPTTVGGWSWSRLRQINFFLDNYEKVSGDPAAIDHYVGIARFFRALFYIDKVKKYNDVPWYNRPLGTDDEELLYKGQDPRTTVVNSIMEDLEFAAAHLNEDSDGTRLNRWAALAAISRFALFEGTFRKYHSYASLPEAERFLQRAESASREIMDSGRYQLYSTGNIYEDYADLFHSDELNGNPEMILYGNYNRDQGRTHNTQTVHDYEYALSRSLADTYLMMDSGAPFTAQAGYDTLSVLDVFTNRDPRMVQTIMEPGFIRTGANDPYRMKPFLGGYLQVKYLPTGVNHYGWALSYNDLPYFRLGEVLLNFAEAKAELGTISQEDLDLSINLLRQRVGMPALSQTAANAAVDPVLADRYPAVTGAQQGVLLEIRRERRVELACEGLRFDDITRWAAGQLLQDAPQGMYIAGLGAMDVTGDGVEDIAILAGPDATGPIDRLPEEVKANLSIYNLQDANGNDASFYLENGNHGHIMFTRNRDFPRVFEAPKYYYRPIPETQLILNSNLVQSPGW